MGTDSYFTIGASHASAGDPCQDYALHGPGYGVIADGCSSSPGRPDLGARLAAIALETVLGQPVREPDAPNRQLLAALSHVLATGLATRSDLLTTVGGFRVDDDGLQAWLWGDGVLYAEFDDGSSELRVVEASDNAPNYPVYQLDDDPPRVEASVNGEPVGHLDCFHWDLRSRQGPPLKTFLVSTDGIAQIADVPVGDAVRQFTAFRTTAGAFLKRRVMRALKGMTPVDDLGVAAYHEGFR